MDLSVLHFQVYLFFTIIWNPYNPIPEPYHIVSIKLLIQMYLECDAMEYLVIDHQFWRQFLKKALFVIGQNHIEKDHHWLPNVIKYFWLTLFCFPCKAAINSSIVSLQKSMHARINLNMNRNSPILLLCYFKKA
jgi:hypothetical protein